MFTKDEPMSLSNLMEGAAMAKFDRVLQNEILPNIADPNTKPDQEREITLKVKFKPDSTRYMMTIGVECYASKIVKDNTSVGAAVLDTGRNGVIAIRELVSAQQDLPFEDPDKVVKIDQKRQAE